MAQKFTVPITVKQLTSAGSDAITVYVDADTYARLKVEAGGRLVWGSGSGAGDVNLYRDGADVLRTDDTFKTPTLFVDSIEIDPTGATTDQVLKFDGTKFVAATAPSGGATNLDGLTDVVITTPEEFQSLIYNGTNWVNSYASTVTYVRNAESTTLTTGTVVYLFGATGDHATVKRADKGSDSTSSKTVGLVGANITASNNGPVVTRGYVDGIDLSVGYSPGDVLWLGSNGAFTKTKATAPDHLVFVGVVVRATNNGIVYVATQNGYELDELHNVAASSPSTGDVLKYNGSLWVNDQIDLGTDTVGNYVSSVSGGTGISVNFSPGEGVGASVSLNAALNDLYDVSTTGASVGDVLTFNGSSWTAASVAAGGGGASVTVSDTPPASPSTGDLWFESDTSRTYVYYDSFWIEIGGVAPGATVSDTAPASPVSGQVWFNSLNGGTYVYYSGAWAEVGAVPVNNLLNLLDAKGDLFVGSADNTAAKLTVGANNYVLTADSSATYGVKWAAIPPSGGLSTTTEGAIMTMAIGA